MYRIIWTELDSPITVRIGGFYTQLKLKAVKLYLRRVSNCYYSRIIYFDLNCIFWVIKPWSDILQFASTKEAETSGANFNRWLSRKKNNFINTESCESQLFNCIMVYIYDK